MTAAATSAPPSPSLAERLRGVHVGLREDLEVSRHRFRKEPAYVVRDPITFQSQRLTPSDYEIVISLNAGQPLSQVFEGLVSRGRCVADEEEGFYQFVMDLHRLGFLRLPVADDKLLYRRYQAKERARRKEKLMGFLFLRVPLWNPNAFLDRTIRYARPLFGKTALVAWLMLIAAAGFVALRSWGDLAQPLQGLMVKQNLVLMWVTLIVLKVFHEFGHAYACKHYGGYVPEMGAYFILFTPCAYMDATASWGFSRKRERIIVCLAGMYVESIIAALAVFVWALTPPSLIHSLAYNVIFLAGVVTVLFNVNPLMRYDGYYILSDLVEVPNLRARSTEYIVDVLKRRLLNIRSPRVVQGRRLRILLFSFGIAACVYRVTLLLAISAVLASRMFLLGTGLAVVYLGGTVSGILRRLAHYLWHAEETTPVRRRAIALGVLALIVFPVILLAVPWPNPVYARGVVTAQHETVVRAPEAGFLDVLHAVAGELVEKGDLIAELRNDTPSEEIAKASAHVRAAEIRRDAFRVKEPDRALQEESRAAAYRKALAESETRKENLTVRAAESGYAVASLRPNDTGAFMAEGAPLATLVSGSWWVRAVLTEEEFASAAPRIGDRVEFRAAGSPAMSLTGAIVNVAPAGSHQVLLSPLTQLGGGVIAVHPQTHEAAEPYFEIVVELTESDQAALRYGMTGTVRLAGSAQPVATRVSRRLMRFVNQLMRE